MVLFNSILSHVRRNHKFYASKDFIMTFKFSLKKKLHKILQENSKTSSLFKKSILYMTTTRKYIISSYHKALRGIPEGTLA